MRSRSSSNCWWSTRAKAAQDRPASRMRRSAFGRRVGRRRGIGLTIRYGSPTRRNGEGEAIDLGRAGVLQHCAQASRVEPVVMTSSISRMRLRLDAGTPRGRDAQRPPTTFWRRSPARSPTWLGVARMRRRACELQRNAGGRAQPPRKDGRLVEAAFPQPGAMQRHRHERSASRSSSAPAERSIRANRSTASCRSAYFSPCTRSRITPSKRATARARSIGRRMPQAPWTRATTSSPLA